MIKRGQFYIIAAAIIAVLLVGLAATVNYVMVTSTPARFYDLGEMYKLEGPNVVDQGIYQGTPEKISETLSNFTDIFYQNARLKDPNIQIIAVFGNSSTISPISYGKEEINITSEATGSEIKTLTASEAQSIISLSTSAGGEQVGVTKITPTKGLRDVLHPGKWVSVKVGNADYNVTLGEKQYFYFIIISKKPTGEVYSTTSNTPTP
jgi:hypothetical protein